MTNNQTIFILLAHPDTDTFSGAIASAYEEGAGESGHAVRRMNIGEMRFDPILHQGYKVVQALEPDLIRFQENVRWADHIVIIYPMWWDTMPAVLKGLFDRTWLPGFAFNFDKETKKLIRRLEGKTARIISVSGAHSPEEDYWCECRGGCENKIERGIMEFAGIKLAVTAFGPSERISDEKRNRWLEESRVMGKDGV